MPQRAARLCAYPGCNKVTNTRFCAKHEKQFNHTRNKQDRQKRGSAAKRGYGHRWRKASQQYKADHPFCVECEREGRLVPVYAVDHIQDHKGDRALFWDVSNWQSLCERHHNQKTMRDNPV